MTLLFLLLQRFSSVYCALRLCRSWLLLVLLLLCSSLLPEHVHSFSSIIQMNQLKMSTTMETTTLTATNNKYTTTTTLYSSKFQRRDLLEQTLQNLAFLTTTATVAATITTYPFDANAVVDDLAMPSEAEQKKLDDEAYAERLRKKAELQQKAALPRTYKESFKTEIEKQSEMKQKTKEERRNAMCEELGRGC